jgi:pimeloyl-ACP methyl ester carboxylesterase
MERVFVRPSEIVVDGVRSPVIEAGPSDRREAVVFIHGNPGSRLDWYDLVTRTGVFARAVAFDAPGFGQADKPRSFEATVPGYAAYIQGALSELGIERAHLVLHDFGAPWGFA